MFYYSFCQYASFYQFDEGSWEFRDVGGRRTLFLELQSPNAYNTVFSNTTFTCDQYAHHVVMDTLLKCKRIAKEVMNKDVVIISSGNPLPQLFVTKVICIQKSVHHDVVGILL